MIFLAFLISFKTKFQNIHMFDLVSPEKKSFDLADIFENYWLREKYNFWGARKLMARKLIVRENKRN